MESIRETTPKIKGFGQQWGRDIGLVALIILTGLISFGLGRLSAQEAVRGDISTHIAPDTHTNPMEHGGLFVASRQGSRYHFPWCSGAQQMAERNKIWFASEATARDAGYTPAQNCRGLEAGNI